MADNIKGKVSSVVFDSVEQCFQNGDFDESWEIEDVTDSCTSGDGEESEGIIPVRTLELTGLFKPAGSRVKGKDMSCTIGATEHKVTDMSFEESPQILDAGESGANFAAVDVGFINRKSSISLFMKKGVANTVRNSSLATTALFATGISVVGNLRIEGFKGNIPVKDLIKTTLDGTWQGAVTKNSMGNDVGDSGTLAITLIEGTSTNQAISGSAMLIYIKVESNYKSFVKITQRFQFIGDISETTHADS